jgi:predicted MPP superfamily phosphohydrolase
MSTIKWLHLSDLHLRGTEGTVDRVLFDNMLGDIREQLDSEDPDLDAVFFTGDVAFSGQIEQYEQAAKRFDEILDVCGLSGQRNRLFIVPGNHDVDRKVVYKPDFVLPQYKTFVRSLLDPDKPYKEINEFLGDDEHRCGLLKNVMTLHGLLMSFSPMRR